MKFETGNMYKHIYNDPDVAFSVDEVLGQDHKGADLMVTWFKKTDKGRYISIGYSGEFHITKEQVMHYLEV